MEIKLMSWNIWIDGHFDEITRFIEESNADIVSLQEVKDNDPKLEIIKHLNNLGYEHVFAPVEHEWDGKVYTNGPAIFSKYKIESSEIFNLHEEDRRVAVRADISVGETTLHVFNTHLTHTHQQQSDVQEAQVEKLIAILPSECSVVTGDFNATPKSSTVKKITDKLVDTDPKSLPTWSMYPEGCHECNPQEVNTRLDYIFVTPDVKTSSFEVGESKGSDHLPISVIVSV